MDEKSEESGQKGVKSSQESGEHQNATLNSLADLLSDVGDFVPEKASEDLGQEAVKSGQETAKHTNKILKLLRDLICDLRDFVAEKERKLFNNEPNKEDVKDEPKGTKEEIIDNKIKRNRSEPLNKNRSLSEVKRTNEARLNQEPTSHSINRNKVREQTR